MPRDVPTIYSLHAEQLRQELPFVWLFELEVPTDPPTRYRLTNYTEPITYGTATDGTPLVYTDAPFVHDGLPARADGSLPSFEVSVGYSDQIVRDTVHEHRGFTGQPTVIRLVSIDALDNPQHPAWRATVSRTVIGDEVLKLELSTAPLTEVVFPGRRYVADSCEHRWLSAGCGYVAVDGATNTPGGGYDGAVLCPRTFGACSERGLDEALRGVTVRHPLRYGGKRGLIRRGNRR